MEIEEKMREEAGRAKAGKRRHKKSKKTRDTDNLKREEIKEQLSGNK